MSFLLPETIFDQHTIALGKTRSGKSTVLRVMVEHLLQEEKPVTIIDPKGDWWGLKASGDGKHAGFKVIIFGGEHADVPLNASSGAAVAELTATGNRPCIIDLGGWMPGARTQFWIDFASTYFRISRGRRWLVIDEVHNLCPKGKIMDPNAGKMLHWSNRLASEGLGKGISLIAASQRPQKVHNDFLTSCETLIALRVIHAADRGALKDWIDGCGDSAVGRGLLDTIASMKRGEAWVWSPEAEFGPSRIQFPMFKTYDSFRPQGAQQSKLSGWAEVDLTEVRKKLESAVKEGEANDPKKLRARIAELERQAKSPSAALADPSQAKEIESLRKTCASLESTLSSHILARKRVAAVLLELGKLSVSFADMVRAMSRELEQPLPEAPILSAPRSRPMFPRKAFPALAKKTLAIPADTNGLSGPEHRILTALHEIDGFTGHCVSPRNMVAAWAGYSPLGGAFANPLGKLHTRGLISYPAPGSVKLESRSLSSEAPEPREVIDRIRGICTGPERRILDVLIEEKVEESLSRDEVARRSGYSAEGGAFANPLGSLRSKGLVDYPSRGEVGLSEWFRKWLQ